MLKTDEENAVIDAEGAQGNHGHTLNSESRKDTSRNNRNSINNKGQCMKQSC